MKYIWRNAYQLPVPAINLGYHKLKTVTKGECPFIVPRVTGQEHLQPSAINVYPDSMLTSNLLNASTLPLSEMMALTAERVLNEFLSLEIGCTLYVWWSGGLDSTAILLTLLRNSKFIELLDSGQALIACNESSALEYPAFWQKTVKHLPQVESDLALYMVPATYHIDGVWADELFGNYQAEHYPISAGEPQSRLRSALSEMTHQTRTIGLFLDQAAELEALFPATTIFQRLWWLEFALSYQDANLRVYYNGSNQSTGKQTRDRFNANLPFRWFAHPSWSAWAMQRQLANKFVNYRESKNELREYIFSLTRDREYFATKNKEYSQGKLYYTWKVIIDANFNTY